jgi:hypothetical protein
LDAPKRHSGQPMEYRNSLRALSYVSAV